MNNANFDKIDLYNRLKEESLYSLSTWEKMVKKFIGYWKDKQNKEHLIRTGYPIISFVDSDWIYYNLGRLYPIKDFFGRYMNTGSSSKGKIIYEYCWGSMPYVDIKTPIDTSEINVAEFISSVTKIIPKVSSAYEEAAIFENITFDEAAKIEKERPKIFALKTDILETIHAGLSKKVEVNVLYHEIKQVMQQSISIEDFLFYLKFDRKIMGFDITTGLESFEEEYRNIGGLTNIFLLLWKISKESYSKTMEQVYSVLNDNGCFKLFQRSDYQDIIGKPEQSTIDKALEIYALDFETYHHQKKYLDWIDSFTSEMLKEEITNKAKPVKEEQQETKHSADFTSVTWYGIQYPTFNKTQAFVVQLLWKEWENGTPTLTDSTIREKIGSNADRYRVSHTFRKHPAFGTMIKTDGKGLFWLSPPESP